MTSSIKPTIGRKVWFWEGHTAPVGVFLRPDLPFDATVVFVHDDGTVNLVSLDHNGFNNLAERVALRDPAPADCHNAETNENGYATWMPYQVGQAKKESTPS